MYALSVRIRNLGSKKITITNNAFIDIIVIVNITIIIIIVNSTFKNMIGGIVLSIDVIGIMFIILFVIFYYYNYLNVFSFLVFFVIITIITIYLLLRPGFFQYLILDYHFCYRTY